ncbi:hypothetical protein PGAL8A_00103400 [Plasmodium gallinaceum]|uniref:Uncharacterized protein n=1 Tax=Plasmodium gallinaceum TaxID=5849 RepID=A0A1J1GLM4_PLAGA|nr:hypothetical protein PGAL8A_00103400 [Plasmodium gallinaceum]CRG93328.1 hypothetical protein PGAL8A_00103400 [Plasmodium gallinaceum]
MIIFINFILIFIFLYFINSIECFKNKLYLNILHLSQNEDEVKSKIDNVEIFDDGKNIDEVKKLIYPRIISYGDFSLNLDKNNENNKVERIELKCNNKYPDHLNHLKLKILKVLLITKTKKVGVTKYFKEFCKEGNSCYLTVQLDEDRNFVDNKIIHLKIINDNKKRDQSSNLYTNINKLKIFFVCEDVIHPYSIPTKSRDTSRYAFSHGQIAYIRCENHKTVKILKISGKESNGKFKTISKNKILSYCSQREICKVNMLDIYNDNEITDFVFYEVKYSCRISQVCRLCVENSVCELDKIYNQKKDVIQFENDMDDNENEIFNRLSPRNEDEDEDKNESEEKKKKKNIENLEYNVISIDLNRMVSVGNNSYHIYEICKCKEGFIQEGLACFKNENEDTRIEENSNNEEYGNIILNKEKNINKERIVENKNADTLENERAQDVMNKINEKENDRNKVNIKDSLNDEKEEINNPQNIQENSNDIIDDDSNENIHDFDEVVLNSKNKYYDKNKIEDNSNSNKSNNDLNIYNKIKTQINMDTKKIEAKSLGGTDSFSVLSFFHPLLFLLFFVSFFLSLY